MHPSKNYCFVGPMIGRKPGHTTTQGQVLSGLFRNEGWSVTAVSDSLHRLGRLAEITGTLLDGKKRFSAVHLEIFGGRSFVVEDIASLICQRRRFPLIMALHGGDLPNFMAKFPSWTRRVLGRAAVITAPSAYLSKAAAGFGFKARVIPNVLDLDAYGFRLRQQVRPELFWMRTFHPAWNPLMALKVLEGVKKQYPEAKLTMAGQDRGMLEECRRFAAAAGLSDAVSFPGFLDMAAKKAAAGKADIFLNTNHIDNMPVAVLEACASGMPVISTDVGGIPEMLRHEETGLLVKDGDEKAMISMVVRLLREPALAAKLSSNGRKLAEQSSWRAVKPLWEQIFQEVSACAA